MRLFVAIQPDAATRAWLAVAQERLRENLTPWERELRWVAPETVHVTLSFLGEIADPEPVAHALEACRWAAMTLRTGGLGVFPNSRRPSVLWAGIGGEADALAAFTRLQADVTQALLPFVRPERRAFSPHLTLARVKTGRDFRPARLAQLGRAVGTLVAQWDPAPVQWRVEQFFLMQSRLDAAGARHTVVRTF